MKQTTHDELIEKLAETLSPSSWARGRSGELQEIRREKARRKARYYYDSVIRIWIDERRVAGTTL